MYATRSRRAKTDRRDARTLMEACRLGAYRVAHRVSAARRHVRAELAVRETLVRTRTRSIALAKALVRRDGLRVAASEAHPVAQRIAALELSDTLAAELLPLFQVLVPINEQITAADHRIALLTKPDAAVALLTTAPSIGPITAAAIVATADDVTRFRFGACVSKRSWGWCRASEARGSSDGSAASRKRATRGRGICSSKRAGAFSGPRRVRPRRCARGRLPSRRGARSGSPWSRWPGSRGDSLRDVARRAAIRCDAVAGAAPARGVGHGGAGPRPKSTD